MGLAGVRSSVAVAGLVSSVLLVSACSSSHGSPTTPTTSPGSGGSSAAPINYDGPENPLPTSVAVPPTTTKKFTVGYMADYTGVAFLVATANEAKANVERLGGAFILKDANLNPQTQVTQLYELISQHVDAIIVHPVDPAALTPGLKQAAAAGIPVIGENATTSGSDPLPTGYRTTVNEALDVAAFSLAKRASAQRPGGSVVLMGTSIPIPTVQYELTRLKYWSERFGLKVLGRIDNNNDTPSGYATAATTLVARYRDAKIVFAYNDPFALTVAQILQSSSIKTALVSSAIGGEKVAFQAVVAGRLDSVYAMPWLAIGKEAVDAVYGSLLSSKTKLAPVVNPHGILVTSANASSVPPVS